MSFFPVKYFLKKFFPAAWFGGEDDIAGPRFANMAATMHGSGTMTGAVSATASLGCSMAGVGAMTGALSAAGIPEQPQVNPAVSASGCWHSYEKEDERLPVYGDMAATISGAGTMTAHIQATGSLKSAMTGKGTMLARPIIDITRLLQRRREEEEMMAMILTAVG